MLPTLMVTKARALFELGELEACLRATEDVSSTDEATALLYWRWQAELALGKSADAYETLVEANRRMSARLAGLSDADCDLAVLAVPIQRQLNDAWQRDKPEHISVKLPAAHAPTGRPTRAHEMIDVIWTVAHALDQEIPSGPRRRGVQLLRLIHEATAHQSVPTVADLDQALPVRPATTRRDLALLRAAGHAVPTRGSRQP